MFKKLSLFLLTSILSVNAYAGLFQSEESSGSSLSLAPMLKKAMPAVVNVAAQSNMVMLADEDEGDEGDAPPSRNEGPQKKNPTKEHMESIGSGVVIDANKGFIITNAHLVKNMQNITVTLSDGRHMPAKRVGIDNGSDIAVLKIDASNLTALPLGDANKLNVGDPVVAIGNPFGLNRFGHTPTATAGIVSALQRSGMEIENYENFIQTDASINPGNSGGALVNLKGELIGINTAILAPNGGNVGIGFAIPINMANNIAQQLIKYGAVHRGLLGILVQPFTPELAQAFKISGQKAGAIVSLVSPGTPADIGGIKVGDLVHKINGQIIESAPQVRNSIGLLRVGDKVDLDILRNGKEMHLEVKIIDPKKHEEQQQKEQNFLFGVALRDYTEQSPYHGAIKGVQIIGLSPGSPAWRSGLRPGDIMTSVNQQTVTSVEEVKQAANKDNKQLLTHVFRGPSGAFILVK